MQYVGKSSVEFSTKMGQHRRNVTNMNLQKLLENILTEKDTDFECSILEKVFHPDPMLLSVREQFWIRKGGHAFEVFWTNRT